MTVTTIAASYQSATFKAEIDPQAVATILNKVDKSAARKALTRSNARQWVIDAFEHNNHLTNQWGHVMAHTLLWLACKGGSVAVNARELARTGGYTLAYEITGKEPEWNFRLSIHPTTTLLIEDMPTIGSA